MPVIEVRVDRRWDDVDSVRSELESLVATAQGLGIEWSTDEYEHAADDARFRDFAPFARLYHAEEQVLEWVTEELVDSFGWRVDVATSQGLK